MDISHSQEIHLKERTNSSGEYEVYTTGIPHGLKYTVKKEGGVYLILNQLGDEREKKEKEVDARNYAHRRALGFLDLFKRNYKGKEKLEIIDEIQLRKDGDAMEDPRGLAGLLKDGFQDLI